LRYIAHINNVAVIGEAVPEVMAIKKEL